MKKEKSTITTINRGFVCGKYLSPHLKEAVLKRIEQLQVSGSQEYWSAYRKGIEIGIAEFRHEQLKRVNQIYSRGDDFGRTR